jgi:hypothetical protein
VLGCIYLFSNFLFNPVLAGPSKNGNYPNTKVQKHTKTKNQERERRCVEEEEEEEGATAVISRFSFSFLSVLSTLSPQLAEREKTD